MREIRAALLKRVLLPSVRPSDDRADHSFVHSVPSVISLSEKDKSGRRLHCTEERRAIRFPPTSSSPSPLLPPRPFPSCLLKFLSGISGQWRLGGCRTKLYQWAWIQCMHKTILRRKRNCSPKSSPKARCIQKVVGIKGWQKDALVKRENTIFFGH